MWRLEAFGQKHHLVCAIARNRSDTLHCQSRVTSPVFQLRLQIKVHKSIQHCY